MVDVRSPGIAPKDVRRHTGELGTNRSAESRGSAGNLSIILKVQRNLRYIRDIDTVSSKGRLESDPAYDIPVRCRQASGMRMYTKLLKILTFSSGSRKNL